MQSATDSVPRTDRTMLCVLQSRAMKYGSALRGCGCHCGCQEGRAGQGSERKGEE